MEKKDILADMKLSNLIFRIDGIDGTYGKYTTIKFITHLGKEYKLRASYGICYYDKTSNEIVEDFISYSYKDKYDSYSQSYSETKTGVFYIPVELSFKRV